MRTDYKFWYIKRDDDIHISECAVRFSEGEYQDIKDSETNEIKSVYIRVKRLGKNDLQHLKNIKTIIKENEDVFIFTEKDFGIISADDELCNFLNEQLSKDKKRLPIEEQKLWQH